MLHKGESGAEPKEQGPWAVLLGAVLVSSVRRPLAGKEALVQVGPMSGPGPSPSIAACWHPLLQQFSPAFFQLWTHVPSSVPCISFEEERHMSAPQTLGQIHGTMTQLRLPGRCLPRTSRLWDLDLSGSPGGGSCLLSGEGCSSLKQPNGSQSPAVSRLSYTGGCRGKD